MHVHYGIGGIQIANWNIGARRPVALRPAQSLEWKHRACSAPGAALAVAPTAVPATP